jgi:hypothetical protein
MSSRCRFLFLVRIVIVLFWVRPVESNLPNPKDPYDYGVDVSFPIHHYIQENTHFKHQYEKFISGCYKMWSKEECDKEERFRLEMSREQPAAEHNYTQIGFKKAKVPAETWKLIKKFYDDNKHKEKLERWGRGYSIVNYWDAPSYMISFEDPVSCTI